MYIDKQLNKRKLMCLEAFPVIEIRRVLNGML